eukprot:5964261-Amphidinium_carterae.3
MSFTKKQHHTPSSTAYCSLTSADQPCFQSILQGFTSTGLRLDIVAFHNAALPNLSNVRG